MQLITSRRFQAIFYIFICFTVLSSTYSTLNAQGPTYTQAVVRCAPNAAFPAETSASNLGSLPACGTTNQHSGYPVSPTLFQTHNPAFYTLSVVESGDIYLQINSSPNKDIYFAIWDSFSLPEVTANCSGGNFPPGIPIDCDYSAATFEEIDVPDAIAGKSYMLMICNFSGDATDVTLSPNTSNGTNTAALGGALGFKASAVGPCTTTDPSANLPISTTLSDPNVSGVSFSGPRITDTDNGTFDPVVAGIGTHTLTVSGLSYSCAVSTDLDITVLDTKEVYALEPAQNINYYVANESLATVSDADDTITSVVLANGTTLPVGMLGRTKESVGYIISKGIAASRISGEGFGGSKLTNDCADGNPCTESEHQKNRRSEFITLE